MGARDVPVWVYVCRQHGLSVRTSGVCPCLFVIASPGRGDDRRMPGERDAPSVRHSPNDTGM